MILDIEVDYDETEHTVFLSHNGSSGCTYECNDMKELKHLVRDYIEDIFYDIKDDDTKVNGDI